MFNHESPLMVIVYCCVTLLILYNYVMYFDQYSFFFISSMEFVQ